MKCIMCDTKINEKSNDCIESEYCLCERCQNKFEKCEICGEYVLGEELAENGICDICNETAEYLKV